MEKSISQLDILAFITCPNLAAWCKSDFLFGADNISSFAFVFSMSQSKTSGCPAFQT